MLFVGAYRSGEVDEGHMLTSTVNTLKDQNTTITQIGTPYNFLLLRHAFSSLYSVHLSPFQLLYY